MIQNEGCTVILRAWDSETRKFLDDRACGLRILRDDKCSQHYYATANGSTGNKRIDKSR